MENFQNLNTTQMAGFMIEKTNTTDRAFANAEVLFLLTPSQYLDFAVQKHHRNGNNNNLQFRYYKKLDRKFFNKGGSDNGKEVEI